MKKRIVTGIGWGMIATVVMTGMHSLTREAGLFPASKPVFLAIPSKILGSALPESGIVALGITSHLAYGGFWGGVLLAMTRRVTVWKGIVMGIFLWLVMHLVVFPFLGRGFFGSHVSWKIVPASLITHLVYGVTLGWLGSRTNV